MPLTNKKQDKTMKKALRLTKIYNERRKEGAHIEFGLNMV